MNKYWNLVLSVDIGQLSSYIGNYNSISKSLHLKINAFANFSCNYEGSGGVAWKCDIQVERSSLYNCNNGLPLPRILGLWFQLK